jgi:hypothetical protein
MYKLKSFVGISLSSFLFIGCTQQKIEITNIKSDIKEITQIANEAIKNNKNHINDVERIIVKTNPKLSKKFINYDLRFDYKNNSTVMLVCKDDIALFENISCNKKIIHDYTKENLPCNFYVEKPLCI